MRLFEKIVFRSKAGNGQTIKLAGYLFDYAGNLFVVAREPPSNWWSAFEFFTGTDLAICHSDIRYGRTRKTAIKAVQDKMDFYGSLKVCKSIEYFIENYGLENSL